MEVRSLIKRLMSLTAVVFLGACAQSGDSTGATAPSGGSTSVLTYQIATSSDPEPIDLAYIDYGKSRLVVIDFNICFRGVPLSAADLDAISTAISGAQNQQTQAMAACASSAGTYRVLGGPTTQSLVVCGTTLQAKFEEFMARPGTLLCN